MFSANFFGFVLHFFFVNFVLSSKAMAPAESKNYITPKGLKTLQEEYKHLMQTERPKIVEIVHWAAGNGDRSENGDYIYGKRRLREIDKRLRQLSQKLDRAVIVDPNLQSGDRVLFGATVTFEFLDSDHEPMTVTIVGEDEASPTSGSISWKSPLAKTLLGKREGDSVVFKRPSGSESIEITEVKFGG